MRPLPFRLVPLALVILAPAFLAPAALAQVGADECANADLISGLGAFPFDTNLASDTGAPATTSFPEQQCSDLTDDVWVRWVAPGALDGHIVRFSICGSSFDSEIALWRGPDCATMSGLGCAEFNCPAGMGGELELTVVGNDVYRVQMGFFSFAGGFHGGGDLVVTDLGPDPCLGAADDVFEENDDCATAAPIGPGVLPNLHLRRDESDYFRISLPADQRLLAHVSASSGLAHSGDFLIQFFDDTCQTLLDGQLGAGERRIAVYSNDTGATREIVVRAALGQLQQFPLCADYELTFEIEPERCLAPYEDGLEPNDTCAQQVFVTDGHYPGLFVEGPDADHYALELEPDAQLEAHATFEHELGDVQMYLYDSFACGTANVLIRGESNTDDERILFRNTSAEKRRYTLIVFISSFGPGFHCNRYSLDIAGAVGGPGTSFCTATPNSSGLAGRLDVLGSLVAGNRDVLLRASGLPGGVPGLFFYGTAEVQVPFGDGFRCAGGTTQRIFPAAFASPEAPAIVQRQLDFDAPYAATIVGGASLSFQLWYRDPLAGMAGFNLTDGMTVLFQ